jgi:signal transduction histidine kinase
MTVLGERWLRRWGAPVLRAFLLAVTVLLGISAILVNGTSAAEDRQALIGLALAVGTLTAASVIASVPPRGTRTAVAQPLVEATVVGLVIAGSVAFTNGGLGGVYSLFLFIPTFVAGQRAGLAGALAAVLLGALPWLVSILDQGAWRAYLDGSDNELIIATFVIGALTAISMLSEWIRRLRNERVASDSSAYADAFRLLSELHHVARNLSLGLDPVTLAQALLDDLRAAVPGASAAVAIPTAEEGRFAPLAGELDAEDRVVAEAWLSDHVVTQHGDVDRVVVPVRMGDRPVAVATLSGVSPSAEELARAAEVIHEAGPRLAAALLFDQVRRLATNDERLRLAREIHDGIAQELASIGYLLDDLAGRVPPGAAEDLALLREHVRKVTGDLRLAIFDIRVGVDDTLTLGANLAEHVQRVATASRLVAHTSINEHGRRLNSGAEQELLRIAQEALTNIRKHACARNVWIECFVDAPDALLRVSDDGLGLQPTRPGSMGLRGMRERARRIGGDLAVRGREGGGTVVEVRLGNPDSMSRTAPGHAIGGARRGPPSLQPPPSADVARAESIA